MLLASTRSAHEVKKIRAVAQAIATLERGKEIAVDAGEIVLLADARIGELTRELPKAPTPKDGAAGPGRGKTSLASRPVSKTERLAQEGITKQQAAECERIADLAASGGLDKYVKACRDAGQAPTTSGAVALAKLPPPARKQVFAKLGDSPDVRKAIGEVKLAQKRELAEEIRANPVVTPDGRYQVIVSDPPWKYDSRAEDASHRGKNQYPDMTTEEICRLPVASLSQKDCILWLWTTNAFMRDAYQCIDAWGFKDKTILTWDKELIGLGDWLRNVTEHCILAVKGKPIVSLTNQTTIIRERRREHSRKPDAFYSLVEALCPGSKLEMFSRTPRDGWAVWGAETGKFGAKR